MYVNYCAGCCGACYVEMNYCGVEHSSIVRSRMMMLRLASFRGVLLIHRVLILVSIPASRLIALILELDVVFQIWRQG